MTTLQAAIRLVALIWTLALAGLVAIGMLRRTVNVSGLLVEKKGAGRGRVSPARIQVLLATLTAAVAYVSQVAGMNPTGHLPAPSGAWIALLGGSNCIYLASKAVTAYRARSKRIQP